MQASPMLFTGIDWNTVRGVFGGKGWSRVSALYQYQMVIGIRFSQSLVLSFFKFLRHRILEALDGLQDDLLSDSGLQVEFAKHSNPILWQFKKTSQPREIPQSDLGSPEAQYDVYLTHPHGQVAVFAHFHNGRNFAVPLKWVGGCVGKLATKLIENCRTGGLKASFSLVN